MLSIDRINGTVLKKAIIHSAMVLRQNKKIVDALNIFPVPDGDTGTNMSLTMDQAAAEVLKLSSDDLKKVADAAAWGSLMGARGNSGVILSQLFRGFAQSITPRKKSLSPQEFAQAYKSGVDAAYRAVMRPVEGTMLTIARETAEKMMAEARRTSDMAAILASVLDYGEKVLDKTPEMLKVLKDAKVVDAGGKGLIFIISGFLEVFKNPQMDLTTVVEKEETGETGVERREIPQEIKYIYCTELFIKGKGIDTDELKTRLSLLGDSLLVIGDRDIVKVHVHTNNPGKVLEEAIKWGELSKIKVDNMKMQHQQLINEGKPAEPGHRDEEKQEGDMEEKKVMVVAVSQGQGLNEIFKSMGADVVEGGQTMNPSTENILAAIEKQTSESIIILPNNKNIIMAAEQAKHLTQKKVFVLPTKSIPQGISALVAFNPLLSVEDNLNNMSRAFENVVTGEVTYAVRHTRWNGTPIKEGDVLGIKDGKLLIVGNDKREVLRELIRQMVAGRQNGIITIYYGKDIDDSAAKSIAEELSKKFESFDVECYSGGQSLYYYIVSVE